MTEAQRTASNPNFHVWVAASAGSGKTKVLTDRVLRLLLSGTLPGRILCLTYTTAAAMEMRQRLQKRLTEWAVEPEAELKADLEQLTGDAVNDRMVMRARRLFAQVLDAPDGVRIQTLHAFCQSLLRRFPLEAGIAPQMELLTDRAQKLLLKEARQRLLTSPVMRSDKMQRVMRTLSREAQAERLEELLDKLIANRRKFPKLDDEAPTQEAIAEVYRYLGVSPEVDEAALIALYLAHSPQERVELLQLRAACEGEKTDGAKKTDAALTAWLALTEPTMADALAYAQRWLTKDGTPLQMRNVAPKAVVEKFPAAEVLVEQEQARAQKFLAAVSAWKTAHRTSALLELFGALLSEYARLKSTRAMLDYDDLILHTLHLLHAPGMSAWVLFKLDGGLDHVLVDEAQDTSNEQWDIVKLLTGEFYSGESSVARSRSLFVVGDEKQSIYRFQGAQPEIFDDMRAYFNAKADQSGLKFERVRMARSFRSAPAVLAAVDAVFSLPDAKEGLDVSESIIAHEAFRSGAAGRVEIWPLTMVPQDEDDSADADEIEDDALVMDAAGKWVAAPPSPRPEMEHAKVLARTIAHWLATRRKLESQNRPLEPGDIMLLVRKRGHFVDALVRQLKQLGVPVAGADRLELNAQLAVKDVLAILDVCLLPEDDLTLAAALRSPILNLSEAGLYALAQGREKATLFARLRFAAQEETHPFHADCARIYAELQHWMQQVDYQPPYALLADILYRGEGLVKLQKRLGPQVIDPVLELMQQALDFAQEECASLQGFLAWVRSSTTEIKRDMEQGQNEVRILTVHGSKGLQAPVVILADTLNMQSQTDPLVWVAHGEASVPLWPVDAKFNPALQVAKETEKNAEARERNRQLYVAMTRAEDELYITGWLPKKRRETPESWYGMIRRGFGQLPEGEVQQLKFFKEFFAMPNRLHPFIQIREGEEEPMLLRFTNPQTSVPRMQASHHPVRSSAVHVLPAWVGSPPPDEPTPPRPLTPSQLDDGVEKVASPASAQAAMRRGQLVHGLLQWLPEIAPDARAARGRDWLQLSARDVDAPAQEALLAQVLNILQQSAFAEVFAPGSLAEVPISGMVQDASGQLRVMNAQVDRLRVLGDVVQVMDYKTTQNPPQSLAQVPASHMRQMAAYRALLARIYPDKRIECALVFTQGPQLMVLPDTALDEAGMGFSAHMRSTA
jgi:ATP-dependent helicase/nuclease subunit A